MLASHARLAMQRALPASRETGATRKNVGAAREAIHGFCTRLWTHDGSPTVS
jgi:hypothetical protein